MRQKKADSIPTAQEETIGQDRLPLLDPHPTNSANHSC
jgi:hypothetical protein